MGDVEGIGLSEAIGQIKAELAQAMFEPSEIRFPVKSVTVELKVVATKSNSNSTALSLPNDLAHPTGVYLTQLQPTD